MTALNNVGKHEHIYRQYGYETGATVRQYTISKGKLSIGAPKEIYMDTRLCNVVLAEDEFFDTSSRCPKNRIYVPNHMEQSVIFLRPMSFTPVIFFWCLDKYADEALEWAYQIIIQNIEATLRDVNKHTSDLKTYLEDCNEELSRRSSK